MSQTSLYFAYGSNLAATRMAERVRSARPAGIACLDGHRVVCNKLGADGSAKANLEAHDGGRVWGVLYELPEADFAILDRFEGGYERIRLQVTRGDGSSADAVSYQSDRHCEDQVPFDWYLALMVEGARAHGLPESYVAGLEALPSRPDPGQRPR